MDFASRCSRSSVAVMAMALFVVGVEMEVKQYPDYHFLRQSEEVASDYK